MKILLISEYFPISQEVEVRGGAESRAFYLSKYLSLLGNQVFVITSQEKGCPKEQKIGKVNVFRVGEPRDFLLGGSLERLKFLKDLFLFKPDFSVDLIDGQNVLTDIYAYYLGKRNKIKKVATYHDVWVGEWIRNIGTFWGFLGEVSERWVLKRDWDLFVAVSNSTKNKLVKNGVSPKKIRIVKNGVDFSLIGKINVSKDKNPTICFVGRLYPYKRVDLLLKATAILATKFPEIRLKIIGSGPQKQELKELAKKLKIIKNVSFFGFVPRHRDVLKEIKSSHVFSLPSDVEGFGMTTVEAMALGVPYVSSNILATAEVTMSGKGGLLFKAGDGYDLSRKIEEILKDDKIYNQYKKEGELIAKKYDWLVLAKQLEGVYKNLL